VDLRERIATELAAGRRRSLDLLAPLTPEQLERQHSPLMSPLVWDLAHVGNYEDLWLVRSLGAPAVGAEYDDMYDAFQHPRADRPALPLLGPDEAGVYVNTVRGRAMDVLERVELDEQTALVAGGFVYGMVIQHEHQHDETMLATLQLMDGEGYRPVAIPAPPANGTGRASEVLVEGGAYQMGTDTEPWAYDNERPSHVVDVPPFLIDVLPTTNRDYVEFVEAGGYDDAGWWAAEGWAWRRETGTEHPQFWRREGGGSWSRLRFGWQEELPLDEPVQHVCWYEADAYTRWKGKRLPTEAEWEKAASWDAAAGRKLRYPWGDEAPTAELANLGQRHFRPAAAGAYPSGASPSGCLQMVGDVWEWTSSDFAPYSGFSSFPYREYSEVFYGPKYKVLRGGSWATDPSAVRTTFRNWDYPIRRQIFCGFRCARDAV
jgi:gamma-glutamyl hercynylcysteine S-oxide synthase